MENCLELIKRVDEREVFLPGQRGAIAPIYFRGANSSKWWIN